MQNRRRPSLTPESLVKRAMRLVERQLDALEARADARKKLEDEIAEIKWMISALQGEGDELAGLREEVAAALGRPLPPPPKPRRSR